ncbi:MAG: sugar ABC transporter ATP-binding protein [Variovorax paradoxus]|nr:MAG: sugar ABC transporter ATP-binding protein [Variovorax paradoxus]PZQ13818.1 MAG: sugar ABC transporter ATP-binding protein [Variovorax paradoxus]
MSSSNVAIKVDGLSKCYQIYDRPKDRLKQFVMPRLRRMQGKAPIQYFREFWALRDVSFEVRKGEVVGIIGRNGSGKSTLLQIICGTLNPTGGTVQTHGRIAALLELGSGFNPEFTGRENVYLNAAVLGLSRAEAVARFDEIVAFSGIGDFIDQPVKTYSSGMAVRLAFAVASCVDPEILIVDEALAVGDISFQHKCFQRIKKLRDAGTTILLVSHDLSSIVEFCNRAYVMHAGKVLYAGIARDAVNQFKQLMTAETKEGASANPRKKHSIDKRASEQPLHASHAINPAKKEYGDDAVTIFDWGILASDGSPAVAIDSSDVVEVVVLLRFNQPCADVNVGYHITDVQGREIVGTTLHHEGINLGQKEAGDEVRIGFRQSLRLAPGEYFLNIGCSEYVGDSLVTHHRLYMITTIAVHSSKRFGGFCQLDTLIAIDGDQKPNLESI